VANDLIWIGVVLRAARSVKELPVLPEVVQQARNACRELRLIGKARKRTRRPTPDELARLREYFARRDARSTIRMLPVLEFAVCSARREAEICRHEWHDNDAATRTGIVRDAKHPTDKDGNHWRFKYTPEAWAIVQAQPQTAEYIFPYDPKSVGTAFTRACHVLGIKDLRFHDLRHETTSRLFERGYQIHEVAQFTLHESWNELKRYTNLRPENMREIPPARVDSPAGDHRAAPTAVAPRIHTAVRSARRGRRHSTGSATFVRQA
jgi:integrase